jgi:hypothetical protein
MSEKDDSNPMHSIGHGRGDTPSSMPSVRKTAVYSFVEPRKTESKNAIPAIEMKTLTVKDVIAQLIEKDIIAWKSLPKSVREALMERPAEFQIIENLMNDLSLNILYNGAVWRWMPNINHWVIHEIVR